MKFCDHAKERLSERFPELVDHIEEIEDCVSRHLRGDYAENVNFWSREDKSRQILRVEISGIEVFTVVGGVAIVTVVDRDIAVRQKHARKYKRRFRSTKEWDLHRKSRHI